MSNFIIPFNHILFDLEKNYNFSNFSRLFKENVKSIYNSLIYNGNINFIHKFEMEYYLTSMVTNFVRKKDLFSFINFINTNSFSIIHFHLIPYDLLLDAIDNNTSLEFIEFCLKFYSNLNYCYCYLYVPVFLAISHNNLEVANLLIEKGANINFFNKDGNLLRISLINNLNVNNIKFLLSKGYDINVNLYSEKENLIFKKETLFLGQVSPVIIDSILRSVIAYSFKTGNFTVMTKMNKWSSDEIINSVITDAIKNLSLYNKISYKPLHEACINENFELIKNLVSLNYDINSRSNINQETSLMVAIKYEKYEIAKVLLNISAIDVNIPDTNQKTPILSMIYCHLDSIEETDKNGFTPLFYSIKFNNISLMNNLIYKYKADTTKKNRKGQTPIIRISDNSTSFKENDLNDDLFNETLYLKALINSFKKFSINDDSNDDNLEENNLLTKKLINNNSNSENTNNENSNNENSNNENSKNENSNNENSNNENILKENPIDSNSTNNNLNNNSNQLTENSIDNNSNNDSLLTENWINDYSNNNINNNKSNDDSPLTENFSLTYNPFTNNSLFDNSLIENLITNGISLSDSSLTENILLDNSSIDNELIGELASNKGVDNTFIKSPLKGNQSIENKQINNKFIENFTELHFACIKENTKLINILIKEYHFDINETCFDDSTPLFMSIKYEKVESIKELLKYKPDLIKPDKMGETTISYILKNSFHRNNAILELLLPELEINNPYPPDNLAPLFYLLKYNSNNIEGIKIIGKAKNFNVNITDENGDTPLIYALKYLISNTKLIQTLLSLDANVNYINKENKTPLLYAIEQNKIEVVRLLINYDANINSNSNDITPLKLAIKLNFNAIVRELLNFQKLKLIQLH
ncbi:ankyrin [Neocallimastix californiae]|uniref:Ankyrin n=1 Tax=Neocallimastix californiae TaxID=1754190 RepID=A0A1Y2CYP3_9FUNG|nr:ankyrin [Neocallimastix californiae]|eukprot:ORY52150.1 ankyrin [Neocallimastix californiae]